MEKPERLLLDLIEHLNQRLTVGEAHAAGETRRSLTAPVQALINERWHDHLYCEMLFHLGSR